MRITTPQSPSLCGESMPQQCDLVLTPQVREQGHRHREDSQWAARWRGQSRSHCPPEPRHCDSWPLRTWASLPSEQQRPTSPSPRQHKPGLGLVHLGILLATNTHQRNAGRRGRCDPSFSRSHVNTDVVAIAVPEDLSITSTI